MEENSQTTIYDDYKFLTTEDLERLDLTDLIGTNLLRAYMHGYFIDYRLYKKVTLLSAIVGKVFFWVPKAITKNIETLFYELLEVAKWA